jgi:hypothetical protein
MSSETDIVGKKIFFVYPTASVQNQVIAELTQHEYEVYISKKHVRLLHVLKKYPDSIVFINIDEEASEEEWGKWIETIKVSLPGVRIGIFSFITDKEKQEKYLKNPQVSCGYTPLKLDMSKAVVKILDILEIINAKGRRKYLRATTEREITATLNLPLHGEIINGTIKDISVVGISCVFNSDPEFSKNALLKDIQIRLQTMLIKAEAVVFGSRVDAGQTIYVLIFTQRTYPEIRVKIRKYIQQNLQSKMAPELG